MVDRAIYEQQKAQLQQQEAQIQTPLKRPAFTSRQQREYQQQFISSSRQYQAQQETLLKAQDQRVSVDSRINQLNQELQSSQQRWSSQKWDKSVRRQEQAIQKGILAELDVLNEVKGNMDKGLIYADTRNIISTAQQIGRERQSQEQQMFSDLVAKQQEKQRFAESQGFKSYDEMLKLSTVKQTGDGLTFSFDPNSFIGEGGKKVTVQEFTEVPVAYDALGQPYTPSPWAKSSTTTTTGWVDALGQGVSYSPTASIPGYEQQKKVEEMITGRTTQTAFESLFPYSPPQMPTTMSNIRDRASILKENFLSAVLTPETRLGLKAIKSTAAYQRFTGPDSFGIQTIAIGNVRGQKDMALLSIPVPSFGFAGNRQPIIFNEKGTVRTDFVSMTDVGTKILPEVGASVGWMAGSVGNLFNPFGPVEAITSTAAERAVAREKRMKTGEYIGGIVGESLGGLVPKTVGEAAFLVGTGAAFKAIPGVVTPLIVKTFGTGKVAVAAATNVPKAAQFGISGLFGYQGAKIATNKELTPGERGTGFIVGGLGALGMASIGVPYIKNIKAAKGKTKLPEPGLEDKPFIRETPGGKKQAVFYERYTGFNLFSTKTWKPTFKNINQFDLLSPSTWKPAFKPQAKGTFLERQYRISDPLVDARLLGLDKQTYYKPVKGKVVQVTESTTPFPFDNPKAAALYFKGERAGVEQYYLPKKFKGKKTIPKGVLDELNAFGFTATPNAWKGTEYGPDVLTNVQPYGGGKKFADVYELPGNPFFVSSKGLSKPFLGLGGEGEPAQIGYNFFGGTPTAYATRLKGVQRNPAVMEIAGESQARGGARTKVYIFRNEPKPGLIQTPEYKMEQEGFMYLSGRTPLRSIFYTKVQGRVVPIEEQTVMGALSPKSQAKVEKLNVKPTSSSSQKPSAYKSPLELYSFTSSKTSKISSKPSSVSSSISSSLYSSPSSSISKSSSRVSSKSSSSLSSSISRSLSSSSSSGSKSISKSSSSYSRSSSRPSPFVSPPSYPKRYKSKSLGKASVKKKIKKKRSYLLTPTGFEAAVFGTNLRRTKAAKPLYEVTGFEARRTKSLF